MLKQEELIEKLIGDINNILKILASKGEKKTKVKIFTIPNEVDIYKNEINESKTRVGLEVEILSVKTAVAEGKIVKAKPGRPGIFLE